MNREQIKQVSEELEKIQKKIGDGAYIFRGEFDVDNGDIISSLYRSYKEICEEDKNLDEKLLSDNLTARDMQLMVLQNVKEYIYAEDVDVLTELQHYKGHTNRIDFSRDYLIALFFACDGNFDKDGRLILLRKDFAEIKEPRKNQNNRVIFQRSVFVEQDSGYILKEECVIHSVQAYLKPFILKYLEEYHGISKETIYGDLPGYIENQKAYQKAHIYFRKGVSHSEKKEFAEAIMAYGESIRLKSNYTEAYFNRGEVYRGRGEADDCENAIVDYDKVIELNPKNHAAYNCRGIAYANKGDDKNAMADFNKAIELKPDGYKAYNNRGIIYKNMGREMKIKDYFDKSVADYKKAIALNPKYIIAHFNFGIVKEVMGENEDAKELFQTALMLAEEQKDKEFIIRAQREIKRISSLLCPGK